MLQDQGQIQPGRVEAVPGKLCVLAPVLRDDSFGDKGKCSEIPDNVEKLRIACDRQVRLIGQKISKQDLAKLRLTGARYRLAQNGGSIIPRGNQVRRQ